MERAFSPRLIFRSRNPGRCPGLVLRAPLALGFVLRTNLQKPVGLGSCSPTLAAKNASRMGHPEFMVLRTNGWGTPTQTYAANAIHAASEASFSSCVQGGPRERPSSSILFR